MPTKRPETKSRGTADLAARFIAHAKRSRTFWHVAAAISKRESYALECDARAQEWTHAIAWMSQWNERASKRKGGLGRKAKSR